MIKVPRSVFILELKEEAVKMVIEGGPDRPGGMPQAFACPVLPLPARWCRQKRAGMATGGRKHDPVTEEQMELARLKA